MFKKSSVSFPVGCVEVDLNFVSSSVCPPIGACVEVALDVTVQSWSGVAPPMMPFFGTGIIGAAAVKEEKVVAVRDSKLGDRSPLLFFTPHEWKAFIQGVKQGEFDLPELE